VTVESYERQIGRALEQLRQQLVSGRYRPAPVRRVTIPKSNGGARELGILTVQDRVALRSLGSAEVKGAVAASKLAPLTLRFFDTLFSWLERKAW
jgi:hypothetical protein